MPDNLTIEGTLYIDFRTKITSFPKNLTVKKDVFLPKIFERKTLPSDVKFKGQIYYLKK